MRYIYLTGLALLLLLPCSVTIVAAEARPQKKDRPITVSSDSAETTHHWNTARKYKRQMRYELARQHYLLALSACRSDKAVQSIHRELQIVELQIRSLR